MELNVDNMERAKNRSKNALRKITELTRNGPGLSEIGAAVLEAEMLVSALSFIYDSLYETSRGLDLIGRRPTYPVKVKVKRNTKIRMEGE